MSRTILAEMSEGTERHATKLRRIDDLDPNQRKHAERILDNLTFTESYPQMDELVGQAIESALECVPTAREAAEQIASLRFGPSYCYLAFFGLDETANYMKVGMSRHPEQRLYSMGTDNPLDCLWVFVSRLPCTRAAFHVEQTLHRHLSEHRRKGEWFAIGNTELAGAEGLARQLFGVAQAAEPEAQDFTLLGTTDGR